MKNATPGKLGTLKSARDKAQLEGRDLRRTVPRAGQAIWKPSMRTADPLDMLLATARNRLPDLLPLRYGRMSHSPFTYMRGAMPICRRGAPDRCPGAGLR